MTVSNEEHIEDLTGQIVELVDMLGSTVWYLQSNWPTRVYPGLPGRVKGWWLQNREQYLSRLEKRSAGSRQQDLARAARDKLTNEELIALKVEFLQSAEEEDRG